MQKLLPETRRSRSPLIGQHARPGVPVPPLGREIPQAPVKLGRLFLFLRSPHVDGDIPPKPVLPQNPLPHTSTLVCSKVFHFLVMRVSKNQRFLFVGIHPYYSLQMCLQYIGVYEEGSLPLLETS